jgi:hypothetical protein
VNSFCRRWKLDKGKLDRSSKGPLGTRPVPAEKEVDPTGNRAPDLVLHGENAVRRAIEPRAPHLNLASTYQQPELR